MTPPALSSTLGRERLVVFGCVRLPIAADDLTLPAFFGIVIRFAALVASAVVLGLACSSDAPPPPAADLAFFIATLAICVVSHVTFVLLFAVSSRGDLLETHRRHQPTLVVFHLLAACYVVELAIGTFGVVLLATNDNNNNTASSSSSSSQIQLLEIVAVVGIAADIVVLGLVMGVMVALAKKRSPQQHQQLDDQAAGKYKQGLFLALKALSYVMCGTFGSLPSTADENDMAWTEISHVFHAFLKDSLTDFTVLDLLAALILVRMQQQEDEAEGVRRKTLLAGTATTTPKQKRVKAQAFESAVPSSEALEVLGLFDEFAPYMTGIYGWKLLAVGSPWQCVRVLPRILMRRMFGDGAEIDYSIFQSRINRNTSKGGGGGRQIVFSSFTSYLEQAVPYTITVDHDKKAVVLTVRGTMSVSDIALDLMCEPVNMAHAEKNWGVRDGHRHYAHGGMLKVASRIRADIDKQQILHRLLKRTTGGGGDAKDAVEVTDGDRVSFLKAMGKYTDAAVPDDFMYESSCYVNDRELAGMDCSQYRLVVCGHSLGSCMASILTVLLKHDFPQVQCLGYSAVSSIFSHELAEECSTYVKSITQGKDVFGRLSWRSMADMRDRVMKTVLRCKVNKFTILTSVLRPAKSRRVSDYLYAEEDVPQTEQRAKLAEQIAQLRHEMDHPESSLLLLPIQRIPMYMPGKIFYLEKLSTERVGPRRVLCCCTRAKLSRYQSTQVLDRGEIQQLHITSRLILDHMPDSLAYNIRQCIKEFEPGNQLWGGQV